MEDLQKLEVLDIIHKLIKENLRIHISASKDQEFDSEYIVIEASLTLFDEEISSTRDTIHI